MSTTAESQQQQKYQYRWKHQAQQQDPRNRMNAKYRSDTSRFIFNRLLPNVHTGPGPYSHRISIEAKRKIQIEMEGKRKILSKSVAKKEAKQIF
jgi:hypothetical protein